MKKLSHSEHDHHHHTHAGADMVSKLGAFFGAGPDILGNYFWFLTSVNLFSSKNEDSMLPQIVGAVAGVIALAAVVLSFKLNVSNQQESPKKSSDSSKEKEDEKYFAIVPVATEYSIQRDSHSGFLPGAKYKYSIAPRKADPWSVAAAIIEWLEDALGTYYIASTTADLANDPDDSTSIPAFIIGLFFAILSSISMYPHLKQHVHYQAEDDKDHKHHALTGYQKATLALGAITRSVGAAGKLEALLSGVAGAFDKNFGFWGKAAVRLGTLFLGMAGSVSRTRIWKRTLEEQSAIRPEITDEASLSNSLLMSEHHPDNHCRHVDPHDDHHSPLSRSQQCSLIVDGGAHALSTAGEYAALIRGAIGGRFLWSRILTQGAALAMGIPTAAAEQRNCKHAIIASNRATDETEKSESVELR